MAWAVTSLGVDRFGWAECGVGDASGCEEILAAPATGVSLYLKKIMVSSVVAKTVDIGAGETGGAVTSAILPTIPLVANSSFTHEFVKPIKLAAATSLTIDASAGDSLTVIAEGETK